MGDTWRSSWPGEMGVGISVLVSAEVWTSMLPPPGVAGPVKVAGLPETGDHSAGKRIDQPACSTCCETSRWITRSGRSSTQPSTWPLSVLTCSQVSAPVVCRSETSSLTAWSRVVSRVAVTSGALRTLSPTALTTHTALEDTPVLGTSDTVTRPDEAAPPEGG